MKNQNFEIAVAQSNIDWTGRKVTGAHWGTIGVKQGKLSVSEGKLTGGQFTIDTASIKILDVTDPATNAQFYGHLASDDFFSIDQYPEANFEITAVNNNQVTGNLTIKGITHSISFDANVSIAGDTLTASGKIVVDRTKYGIKFRSGNFFTNLGDTLIYNDFDLNVNITAKAA
ncbi:MULTISPECIES: YceI family protein [Niastella]|uniref:YceI family protein n=1 Tax=Niastella soli TaxID=2821487 RepID=A0ABS3YSL8_9BACT|nr:YceI family protein [Niastella soli]MBO9200201.1 YceI family protein [Niastella soli]